MTDYRVETNITPWCEDLGMARKGFGECIYEVKACNDSLYSTNQNYFVCLLPVQAHIPAFHVFLGY